MGFGPSAVLGVAASGVDRPAVALVGDGAFGSNPNVVATAVEMGIAPIWVVMNNAAFGTIAGLERKHYGSGFGCEFLADGTPYSPDFAAIARACGADGIRVADADALLPGAPGRTRLGPPDGHRRADAQHAGHDAWRVGHRAHLPRRGSGDGIQMTKVHEGAGAGQTARATAWSTRHHRDHR